MKKVRILLYNQVGQYPDEAMEDGLHPDSLKKQLDYLLTHGYSVVSLEEALACIQGKKELAENSVALTIDGGYEDAYTSVLPTLEEYGVEAAFFIPPALNGQKRVFHGHEIPCMGWEQVRSLAQRGMIISHSGAKRKWLHRIFYQIPNQTGSKPLCHRPHTGRR